MLMKVLRVVLAILYSAAFIFSLTRCSPNAASIDKHILHSLREQNANGGSGGNGGINVDATLSFKQPELKVHFVREKEFRKIKDDDRKKDETRIDLKSTESGTGSLDSLKADGEAEFALDQSNRLYPAEAWLVVESKGLVEKASSEKCGLEIAPSHEGSWRVSVRDSEDCNSKQEIISEAKELLISFREKDSHHLINSVTTPDAP
jgi:hypothetical protein